MLYIEKDVYSCTLFKVESIGGHYFGWNKDAPEGWKGGGFTLFSDEGHFSQTFLAPSILDRW